MRFSVPERRQGMGFDQRRLLGDKTVPVVPSVAALEFINDAVKRDLYAGVCDDGVRQLPVVIEAAQVFITLCGTGLKGTPCEVAGRFFDGPS